MTVACKIKPRGNLDTKNVDISDTSLDVRWSRIKALTHAHEWALCAVEGIRVMASSTVHTPNSSKCERLIGAYSSGACVQDFARSASGCWGTMGWSWRSVSRSSRGAGQTRESEFT